MKKRTSQAFHPRTEAVEERLLTTVLPWSPPAAPGGAAAHLRLRAGINAAPRVAPVRGNPAPMVTFGSPRGAGGGAGQGGTSTDYMNWGVITIWNKTPATVTYSVAASTFDFGRYQNFTLRPGARQAFYASFGGSFNSAPTFFVSFDPIQRSGPLQVTEINVVNETPRWFPRVGTEGRPYAITNTVGALNLTPMS